MAASSVLAPAAAPTSAPVALPDDRGRLWLIRGGSLVLVFAAWHAADECLVTAFGLGLLAG